jgi:chaperonin GroES
VDAVEPGSRNQNGESWGNQVLLPEYGGTKVELEENSEFHYFRESDIFAKLES